MTRIFFRMLLGLVAGLAAWALLEPSAPSGLSPEWGAFEIHMVMALGIFAGFAIGGYNGYVMGGKVRLLLGLIAAPFLGFIGAQMGYGLGGVLQVALFHRPIEALIMPQDLVVLYLSRIVALTPIGTMVGAAIGIASLDWRRAVQGAIGGTIGGAIGAMLFDPVAALFGTIILTAHGTPSGTEGEIGTVSRMVYFTVMAGCIALFIGIVEQMAKQASLRLALGRNEGREFPLFGQRTLIGRNELAQVPIFNDPAVAPVHAYVDRRGPVYWLQDGGSGAPTFLNGQPISAAPLDHGAHIQVGNTVLQFLLKALPRSVAPQGAYAIMPQQGNPMPMHAGGQMLQNPAAALPSAPAYQPMPAVPLSQPTTVLQAQPGPPSLVATDGPLAGQRFAVASPLEIGREGSGLALRFDSSASRRHVTISPGPAGLMLTDLGSTNGTFVNGQRVTSATLKPGDLVRIGATTFRVE
jgi:pSer/pThr/pTyr-binding forkhead associated (FHA) protein